jgi:hypothetical protein
MAKKKTVDIVIKLSMETIRCVAENVVDDWINDALIDEDERIASQDVPDKVYVAVVDDVANSPAFIKAYTKLFIEAAIENNDISHVEAKKPASLRTYMEAVAAGASKIADDRIIETAKKDKEISAAKDLLESQGYSVQEVRRC